MPRKNKYVDFVSDEHFVDCVRYVCEAYPSTLSETVDMKKLQKNMIDPFKMLFDILNKKITPNSWVEAEIIRQSDKNINNKIGEFHQKLLGGVNGWKDLNKGHRLGIDLKNDQETIFIELKNKHNTVKGENLKDVFDKLKKVAVTHPKAIVYYAYIIPKKSGSGEKIWKTSQRVPHQRIREIWGSGVYELVTGDKNALEHTWKAIPQAISDKYFLNESDVEKLKVFFKHAFNNYE